MNKSLLIFLLLLFISNASASKFTGKIIRILVHPENDKVFLSVDSDPTDRPNCFGGTFESNYSYVFNGSTDSGKSTLSVALMAYSIGKEVNIGGLGTCDLHSDVEDLGHLRLQ
jgi:hypothetical protein